MLCVPWDLFGMAYAFPPTTLVHDMLMKLWDLDLILIVIAPWRLNQSWFPDLLEVSIDHPVELSVTQTSWTQLVGD